MSKSRVKSLEFGCEVISDLGKGSLNWVYGAEARNQDSGNKQPTLGV